ncbi:2-oxoglutarate-dependent dioxygenase DAO [Morella rubra]|uniref:2-oxoglutarate-dependent dioxygenase DAO n=1 Tax=Morella rubra TaxID=262757 RepID=A0A6A1WX03_9ROSI|nr:2-oxoglutarate-dependent dioxygenase DAO [Morella rubra]
MAEGGDSNCIPVLDMQEFVDPEQCKKLREASEEWGCFRIINHKIPGVAAMSDRAISILFTRLWASMIWAPSRLCVTFVLSWSLHHRETIEMYAQAIHELAMELGRMLAKSMGLVSNLFEEWPCQFRINKYDFTPEAIGASGVQIHTDSGFLTILQDDENVGGLEVMDKSGAFVSVQPWAGTLLVNLGDLAKAWSNGRFCNVKHRVQCKEASIRVSIASFVLGPKEAAVEAPPELVDAEHPRLYVPFSYEDYRKIRLSTKLSAGEALELLRTHSG